jgi:ribosome recycling factor
MWTSPNRTPIFAIIGHWYTPDFEEREEVLEFVEIKGSHTREELAKVVKNVLEELKIKHKLFAITSDNASNNSTLCQSLYNQLKRQYDDKFSLIRRPRMRFHGFNS